MTIKEILNTQTTIQLEVSLFDFEKNGFDMIWDEIREKYNEKRYSIQKFEVEKYRVLIKLLKKP